MAKLLFTVFSQSISPSPFSSDTIVCPECNNDVSLGFVDMDKCPNCGSKKFEVNGLIVDY